MPDINVREIPRTTGNMMAESLFTAISEYFLDPQHQKEFEEWEHSEKNAVRKE